MLIVAPLPTLPVLSVKGPRLLANRKAVRLTGVNVASLEWTNEGEHVLESVREATANWGANTIRIPLSQDRWFGKAPGQTDGGTSYRKIVDDAINTSENAQAYAVLDLHWSNAGVWGQSIAQHRMPDANSLEFWRAVAKAYKNRSAVLFDLYNEPHDVDWKTWRDGGDVTEDGKTYRAPGMQTVLDAVRSTGAKNVCLIGGLDWAYDLSGVLDGYALKDPKGNGIMYSAHIYPWKSDWDGKVGRVAKIAPVFVGEVGGEPENGKYDMATFVPKILDWMDANALHWTAWCFHPGASPRMLKDWSYTPTDFWGAPAKARLVRIARDRG